MLAARSVVSAILQVSFDDSVSTMFPHSFATRTRAAWNTVRAELLAAQEPGGHWVGELASSPLSTATAITALVIAEQYGRPEVHGRNADALFGSDQIFQGDLSELIVAGLYWLANQQNTDGGWGDTDRSRSNIATTMLVVATFRLTGIPARYSQLLDRAEEFIQQHGGVFGLRRRYGKDKTFVAPILACCALADMVSWRDVPALPFELACLPRSWYRWARMPVVSYAIPALVAIGQARYHHVRPFNPITRLTRRWALERSILLVERMQPASGGFLEATPLTSFVVMCLASIGLAEHRIVRRGVEFLLSSVRPDGSWPVDSNLAIWNTSLAIRALDTGVQPEYSVSPPDYSTYMAGTGTSEQASEIGGSAGWEMDRNIECLDWLLDCQKTEPDPCTGAEPGGWAWTDLPGGVPDVDDTSGVLWTLAQWRRRAPQIRSQRIEFAARMGIYWLLDMQNRNGGWPTFCRGWGHLPCDQSATDITAHALQAIHAWQGLWSTSRTDTGLDGRFVQATARGLAYLGQQQRPDGSWIPLWFGNQYNANEENPVFGTARVLQMFGELDLLDDPSAQRAAAWLVAVQHVSGGWGIVTPASDLGDVDHEKLQMTGACSVEETAAVLSALQPFAATDAKIQNAVEEGFRWLVEAVEVGLHHAGSPIGYYFARLWYHERLYPLIFATDALRAGQVGRSEPIVQRHYIQA